MIMEMKQTCPGQKKPATWWSAFLMLCKRCLFSRSGFSSGCFSSGCFFSSSSVGVSSFGSNFYNSGFFYNLNSGGIGTSGFFGFLVTTAGNEAHAESNSE